MTSLDRFRAVLRGPWTTGALDTQWRLEGRTLYLQATASLLDWILNFLFLAVPVAPYRRMAHPFWAHLGFVAAYKANAEAIQALDFDTIVGYSRGGALALLAHEDRLFRTGVEPETFVFGCPAVFSGISPELAGRWSRVTRYESPRDVVTKVCGLVWLRHVGRLVKIGGRPRRPAGYSWLLWISGHSPSEYKQRLEDYEREGEKA